jgi:hypothetical protein
MANKTVQIISQQYGIGTIANAASEETLRELLKAINEFDDEINNNAPGSNTAEKNTSKNTLSRLGKLTSGVKNTVSGMKNTGAAFTSLLSKGSTNLSEYGQALNDNLIKGLPIFGQALGGLADGLIATVAIFEGWNATLKTTAQVGASFNNSIVELRLSAAKAQMPLDDFAKMITTNSQDFLILGDTVTKGAKTFTNFVDQLYREGTGILESMSYLGYSGSETSMIFFKYVTTTMRGHKLNMNDYGSVIERFKEYNKHMERLKNLSGKSRESIEDMTKKVTDDELFKLQMSDLRPQEQNKIKKVLDNAVVVAGDSGANLVNAYVNNVKTGNKQLDDFNTYMPATANALTEMMEKAKDTTVTVEEFSKFNEDALIKLIMEAKRDTVRIRKQFATNNDMPAEALAVFKYTGDLLAKFGDLDKLTPASIRARLAAQKTEQNNIEELTKILRDFGVAVSRLNSDVIKAIGPGLKKIGDMMEKNKVTERVEKFGEWLSTKMAKLIPKVFEFFENLGDPEFRRQLGNEFAYDMAIALERLKGVIGRAMIPGMIGREYQKRQEQKAIRLELAQDRTKKSQATVREKGTAETPMRDIPTTDDQRYLRETTNALVQEMRKKGVQVRAPFEAGVKSKLAGEAQAGIFGVNRTGTQFEVASGTNVLAISGGEIQFTTLGGKPAAIVYDPKTDTSMVYRNLATDPENSGTMKGLIARLEKQRTVSANELIGIVDTPYNFDTGKSATSMLQLEVRKGKINPNALFGGYGDYVDPEDLMKYRNGTLGDMSKGFGNAGKLGTTVALHGTEAVVSPEQLSSSLTSIGQISLAEFITSLNSNVNLLISLTREDIRVERSKLSAQEKMKLSH